MYFSILPGTIIFSLVTNTLSAISFFAEEDTFGDLDTAASGLDAAGNFVSASQSVSASSGFVSTATLQTPFSYRLLPADTGSDTYTFTNATNSLMQLSTEPVMRGRVMALRVAIALGGTPIGAPIVGWVANDFGPRWALGVGASAGFAAAFVACFALGPA